MPGNLLLIAPSTNSQYADGSLWTLWYEIRFYLLITFFLHFFNRSITSLKVFCFTWLGIILTIRGCGLNSLTNLFMADFGSYFIGGILIATAKTRKERIKALPVIAVCAALAGSARLVALEGPSTRIFYLGCLLAPLIVCGCFWTKPKFSLRLSKPAMILGRVSYPLYLLQSTTGISCLIFLRVNFHLSAVRSVIISLIGVLSLAFFFALVVEQPMKRKIASLI